MVMNFMKVKEGKFKTFENMEIDLAMAVMPDEKFRTGWTLQKRIDKYGTDLVLELPDRRLVCQIFGLHQSIVNACRRRR